MTEYEVSDWKFFVSVARWMERRLTVMLKIKYDRLVHRALQCVFLL